jgi:hypothetical protein
LRFAGLGLIKVCEDLMTKEFDVRYGEEEFRTVREGIEAIQAVLMGNDIHAKERLLFFLDWYMDPYYKRDLSVIGEPLKELLQNVAAADSDMAVAEEALHLLEAYTEGPYTVLEANRETISPELMPVVRHLLNGNI